jgi:hypothetical protein
VTLEAEDSDDGHGNHQIHLASDHKIRATSQPQPSVDPCQVLPSTVFTFEAPSPCFVCLFLVERVNPPGGDFPDPLLPRAPPFS